jgi:hypothetical protein
LGSAPRPVRPYGHLLKDATMRVTATEA